MANKCLIKTADKSSYGPLSRAGIEYNTYLASKLENENDATTYRQHERRVKPRPKSCIANTSTKPVKRNVSFDMEPPKPNQSIYSGLSYVPFNYCDDLQIDDIYDVFKNKRRDRGMSADSGNLYSPDSGNHYRQKLEDDDHYKGNDYSDEDEYAGKDTYKVSKISYYIPQDGDDYKKRVTHYASSEGLLKSPKPPVKRITVRIGTRTHSATANQKHIRYNSSSEEEDFVRKYTRKNPDNYEYEKTRKNPDNYEYEKTRKNPDNYEYEKTRKNTDNYEYEKTRKNTDNYGYENRQRKYDKNESYYDSKRPNPDTFKCETEESREQKHDYKRENLSLDIKNSDKDRYENLQRKYENSQSYYDSKQLSPETSKCETEETREQEIERKSSLLLDKNVHTKYNRRSKLPPNSEMIARKYSRFSFLTEDEQKLNDKYNKKKYGEPKEDDVFDSPTPLPHRDETNQKKKVNLVLRCSNNSSSNSEKGRTYSSDEYNIKNRNQDRSTTKSAEDLLDASAESFDVEEDAALQMTKREHFEHCRRSLQEPDMYMGDGKLQEWWNADGSYSAKFVKRNSFDYNAKAFSNDKVLTARALKNSIEENINETLERQRHYPFRIKRLTSDKYERFLPKDEDETGSVSKPRPAEHYPDIYKNSAQVSFKQLWGSIDDTPLPPMPQVHHPIATLPRKPKTEKKKPDEKRDCQNRIVSVEGFRRFKGSSGHNRAITNVYELANDGWIDKTRRKMKKKISCLNLDKEIEKLIKMNSIAVINLGKLKLMF